MKKVLDKLDVIIKNTEDSLNCKSQAPESGTPHSNSAPDHTRKAQDSNVSAVEPRKKSSGKKKKNKDKSQSKVPVIEEDPAVDQFLQCDLRVGRITEVGSHPEADGLYVLKVSYGREEVRTVCAGLRKFIPESEMKNRAVATICNLKPRKLRGVNSEAMLLAGSLVHGEGEKEKVIPLAPPESAAEGDIISVEAMQGERTVTLGKHVSGKTWDKVVSRLKVLDGKACYKGASLAVGGRSVLCDLPDGAAIH